MSKLTVVIPCKNERLNIRPCVESVRACADEILIADSGSTDNTLDIVRSLGGCRIVEREYVFYGDFLNWAIPQASHPWVLVLDADERLTPELAHEIRRLLTTAPVVDGFEIVRNSYFMGHRVKHCGWNHDFILRLVRRDSGKYVGDTDHARLAVDSGKIARLHNCMEHFTFWTYQQYLQKLDRYSSYQAQRWHIAGRRPSVMKMLFSPPLTFLKVYLLQLGILDGAIGVQLSMLQAYYSFSKQAQLWELHYARRRPNPEAEQAARAPKHTPMAA